VSARPSPATTGHEAPPDVVRVGPRRTAPVRGEAAPLGAEGSDRGRHS
jgi:hypothetical protein